MRRQECSDTGHVERMGQEKWTAEKGLMGERQSSVNTQVEYFSNIMAAELLGTYYSVCLCKLSLL